MDGNNDFDVDSYYDNNSNGYSNNSNYNKSSNSYDEVFKSYSDNNKKIKLKKKNKNKDNKGIIKKLLIIIFLLVIIGGIGYLIYKHKDEIIEIVEPKKNPIIEVEVLDSNLSLIVGDTRKLNYKMTNSEDVSLLTFASSNTTVAKVDKEGNIKAIGAGDAIISVSYMGEKGKVTKTCYVTIKNVDVDNIEVKEKEINVVLKWEMATGFSGVGQYLPAKNQCYQSGNNVCKQLTKLYAGLDNAQWSCIDSKTNPPASTNLVEGGICWCYVPKY